jgi:hypothetical protein
MLMNIDLFPSIDPLNELLSLLVKRISCQVGAQDHQHKHHVVYTENGNKTTGHVFCIFRQFNLD